MPARAAADLGRDRRRPPRRRGRLPRPARRPCARAASAGGADAVAAAGHERHLAGAKWQHSLSPSCIPHFRKDSAVPHRPRSAMLSRRQAIETSLCLTPPRSPICASRSPPLRRAEQASADLVDAVSRGGGAASPSGVLAPLNRPGDRSGARLENGVVRTPDGLSRRLPALTSRAAGTACRAIPSMAARACPWRSRRGRARCGTRPTWPSRCARC